MEVLKFLVALFGFAGIWVAWMLAVSLIVVSAIWIVVALYAAIRRSSEPLDRLRGWFWIQRHTP